LKILVGLLTGHNSLNQHLNLLKIAEDPMCPLCGKEYDASLHLGRCSALTEKQRKQFGNHLLFSSEIIIIIIIIIIRAFVRRTMSASELNLRRRTGTLEFTPEVC